MEAEKNLEGGLDPDPLSERRGMEGFPAQKQAWPGLDLQMNPRPDHGERTYRGSGKLKGRTALITGGDSGIGRAIAIAYAREGADVAIVYHSEHEDAEETVRWIRDAGRLALALPGDLRDPAFCRESVERTVREFGRVGILVNNAAVHQEKGGLADITPEQLDWTFRTNVYATFWLTQAALPQMKAGDVVINTGSVTGLRGSPRLIDYAATKAAIHNFTVSLAKDVAPRGIRVNCVSPGPVWTPLIVSTRDAAKIAEFGTDTVWGRAAQPAEIAPTYVFLASGDSRYYTGEIFAPTGGDTTR
jgi:NAD(P)-dependent dehydrogenase (short-subunit alcohol dehydrogenase family)